MTRLAKKINVLLLSLAFALTLVLGFVGLGASAVKANADDPAPITTDTIQADLDDKAKGTWNYVAESDIVLDFAESATEQGSVEQKSDSGYALKIVGKVGTEKVTIKNLHVKARLGAIYAENVELNLVNVSTEDISKPGSEVYALRAAEGANVKLEDCKITSGANGVQIYSTATVTFWGDNNTVTAPEIAIKKSASDASGKMSYGTLKTYGGTFTGALRTDGKNVNDDIEYGKFTAPIDDDTKDGKGTFERAQVTKDIGGKTYYMPKNFEVTAESEETTSYSTIEEALAGGNALNKDFTVKFFVDSNYQVATTTKYFAKAVSVDSAKAVTLDLNNTVANMVRGFDVGVKTAKTTLTIKNGQINSEKWAVWAQNGADVTIKSDLIINANSEKFTDGCAISAEGANTIVDISGKVYSADNYAIATSGNANKAGATINVNFGAEVKNNGTGVAIYLPSSTLIVGESCKIEGETAIYVKGGTLNISGGDIIGTGTKTAVQYYGNGCYPTGDALVIENCGYPAGKPVVSITGGAFTSTNASPIASYVTNGKTDADKVMNFISSGYFKSLADDTATPAVTAYTALGRPSADLFATGKACSYTADGTYSGQSYYQVADEHAFVEITGGTRNYSSIQEAIDTVSANETIKVYDSHTISADINANTDLAYNLDLNEKTVSCVNQQYITFNKGTVTISNGIFSHTAISIKGGKITFDDKKPITAEHTQNVPLNIYGGEVVINGGTFTRTSDTAVNASYSEVAGVKTYGDITIKDGTFNGGFLLAAGKAKIEGGKFIATGSGAWKSALTVGFTTVDENNDILVTGGTFESKYGVAVYSKIEGSADDVQFIDMCSESSNKAAPSTTMKNFKSYDGVLGNPVNPTVNSAYLITPSIYKNPLSFIKEKVDGVYYDTIQQTIAQILDTDGTTVKATYSVLQRAFNDVLDGETIQLIDSFNQASKLDVNTGKKFTFDINGEKLTATTGKDVVLFDISNATNVTIVDNATTKGSISAKDAFAKVFGAKSELTIDSTVTVTSSGTGIVASDDTKITINGTLTTAKLAVETVNIKGAGSELIIGSSATVTSSDAGIVATSANVSILGKLTTAKLAVDVKGANSVLVIEDTATVTSSDAGIVAADGANVRIYGTLTSAKLAIDAKGAKTRVVIGQGAKITVNSVKEHAIKVTEGADLRIGVTSDFKHKGITFITNTLINTTSAIKDAVSAIYVEGASVNVISPDTIIDGANVALELVGTGNEIKITNGLFLTEGNEAKGAASIKVANNEHAFIVNGLFNVEPAANFFVEGKASSLEKNEDGYFYVVSENARVIGTDVTGDYRYASLDKAIENATDKDTVILTTDVTENVAVNKTNGEFVTVDFKGFKNDGSFKVTGKWSLLIKGGNNNGDFIVGGVGNPVEKGGLSVVIDEDFTIYNGTLYVNAQTTLKGVVTNDNGLAVQVNTAVTNEFIFNGLTVEETAKIISKNAQAILLSVGELYIFDDEATADVVATISGKTAGIEAWEYTKLNIVNAVVTATNGPALLIDVQYADTDSKKTEVLIEGGIYTSESGMAVVSKAAETVTPVSEFVAGEGVQFNSKTEEDAVKVVAQHIVAEDYFLYIPDSTKLNNLKTTAKVTNTNRFRWARNYPDNSIVDGFTTYNVFGERKTQTFYSIYLHKDVEIDTLERDVKVNKAYVVNSDGDFYFIDNNEIIRLNLDLFIVETYTNLLNTVKYGEYGKVMLEQVVALFITEIGGIPGVETPLIEVPTTFSGLANAYDMYINAVRVAYDNLLAVPDLQTEIKLAQDNLIKYYYDVNNLLTTLISDGYKFDKEAMLNKLVDVLDEINEFTYINAETTYEEILEDIDAEIERIAGSQFYFLDLINQYAGSIEVTPEPEFVTAIREAKNDFDISLAFGSCMMELDKYKDLRDLLYNYAEQIKANTASVMAEFKESYCRDYNAMFDYLKSMNTTIGNISTDIWWIRNSDLPNMKNAIIDQIKAAITEAKNAIIADTDDIQAKLVTLSANIGFENEKTLIQSIIAYKDEIKNYANALINDASTGAVAQIGAKITTAEGKIIAEIGKLKTYLEGEIATMEADLTTLKTNLSTLSSDVATDYADILVKIKDAKDVISGILNDTDNGLAAINANVDAANTAIAGVKEVVDKILKAITEDLTKALKEIKEVVDAIKTSIGYTDTTVMDKIAAAELAISNILNDSDDGLEAINDNIDKANTTIGEVKTIVEAIKASVGDKLTERVDSIKTFITDKVVALLNDKTNGLAAINANVDAAELAISNILNDKTNGLAAINTNVDAAELAITNAITGAKTELAAALKTRLDTVDSTLSTLLANLAADTSDIKTAIDTAKTAITTLVQTETDNIDTALSSLSTQVATAETNIKTAIDTAKKAIVDELTKRFNTVDSTLSTLLANLAADTSDIKSAIDTAKTAITTLVQTETDNIDTALSNLSTQVTTAETNIKTAIDTAKTAIVDELTKRFNTVDKTLTDLAKNIGFEEGKTLVETILEAKQDIKALVQLETDNIDTAIDELSLKITNMEENIKKAITEAKLALAADLKARLDRVDQSLFDDTAAIEKAIADADAAIELLVNNETDDIDDALAQLKIDLAAAEENVETALALAEENITSLEEANHKADVDDRYANNTAILWIISIALGITCAVVVLVIIVRRKR